MVEVEPKSLHLFAIGIPTVNMACICKTISAFDQNGVLWQLILKFNYCTAFGHLSRNY